MHEKIQNAAMEDLKQRLQDRQCKLTRQRRIVLDVFLEHKGEHLSAEDVYSVLKEKSFRIGLATVYRSLDLLADIAILQKMEFGDGCSRYELGVSEPNMHQHHHLICLKCHKVTEFPDILLEELEHNVSKKTGFKIVDHQVKFFGYCEECK